MIRDLFRLDFLVVAMLGVYCSSKPMRRPLNAELRQKALPRAVLLSKYQSSSSSIEFIKYSSLVCLLILLTQTEELRLLL